MRAARSRTHRQWRQLLDSPALDAAERELLAGVGSRISHEDGMYKGDGAHYFGVGLDAIRRIDEALAAARVPRVGRILDLPCGYGRVLRFLVRRFPEAEVTACEIMPDAVRFCVEHFGANPARSTRDLDALRLAGEFDLIWCGSLVTHLEAARTGALLRFFARHLAPGGLLLFTAHGDYVAGVVGERADFYGLREGEIPSLVESYRRTGFGYLDYPEEPGYGVSLTSPAWVRDCARGAGALEEVYFRPRGWDNHQDVYGFVKRA